LLKTRESTTSEKKRSAKKESQKERQEKSIDKLILKVLGDPALIAELKATI